MELGRLPSMARRPANERRALRIARPGGRRPPTRPALRRGVAGLALGLVVTLPAWGGTSTEARKGFFADLNRGVAAHNKADYPVAIEHLERAASVGLSSFRAHYYLGLARLGDRRFTSALDALDVALDLDPDHLRALVAYGDAWLALGDLDEAKAGYIRALKARPEFPGALAGLARVADAQGDIAEAIRLYRRSIESNAGFSDAYIELGELYLREGRFREAVVLLEEAVSIRPEYARGHNRLARAYGRLGLVNEAVAAIQRAIELDPGTPEHPATLGRLQIDLGLPSRAERTLRSALEIDPRHPGALRALAELARRRGDLDGGIGHVATALEDDRLTGRERRLLEEYRAALVAERDRIAELEATAETGDATPEALRELARIHAMRADWSEAADLLGRAAGDHDAETLAYYLVNAGRYREALATYDIVERVTPGADVAFNRGVALAHLGRDAEALAALDAAKGSDRTDLTMRVPLYRGNALLRLGRIDEAADAYLRFLERADDDADAERVRRILAQIAPERLPKPEPEAPPAEPGKADAAAAGAERAALEEERP